MICGFREGSKGGGGAFGEELVGSVEEEGVIW